MIDTKAFLKKLQQNLNLLKEREAKYGGSAPLELQNQITDHQKAIDLTEQVINGDISEAEWQDQLQALLIAGNDWQEISLAVMLVMDQYVQDNGEALRQTVGNLAAEKAGEIAAAALEQIKVEDPRTAKNYPQNPTGYQTPLNDVLDEILEANTDLMAQLKTMLEQYQTMIAESKPDQSTNLQANLSGPGVITQQSTQTAGERGVVGSSAGSNIITGDGNVVGNVSVEGSTGAVVGGTGHQVSVTQGLTGEELAQIFTTLQQQVAANPNLTPETKADVKAELNDLQTETAAAEKGESSDESFIRRRLNNLERMAPDIIDTIATTIANPVAGLKGVWDKVVVKAREIKAARQTL